MSSEIDPYIQLLNISDPRRPLSHYALLGLPDFENDAAKIASASKARLHHLRSLLLGPQRELAQRLIGEVMTAAADLENPGRRLQYDAKLRGTVVSKSESPNRPITAASQPLDEPKATHWFATIADAARTNAGVLAFAFFAIVALTIMSLRLPFRSDRTNNAVDNPAVRTNPDAAAVLRVERLRAVPLTVTPLPEFLQNAIVYDWEVRPSASPENGVLEFHVELAGSVFLAPHWNYEGNDSGGWTEERKTKDQLIAAGWQDFGPCVWDNSRTLMKRSCQSGDIFRIRTNKYWPPLLILPATQ